MSMKFDDDWWSQANCGGCDPRLFEFPNKKAVAMCAECPVREMCLEHVMESPWPPYGIWAGLMPNKVQKAWRKRHPRASRAEVDALMGLIA